MSCPCSGDNHGCGNYIDLFVYNLWENNAQMAGQSLAFVSGWTFSPTNLGRLNNLIDTDFYLRCLTGSGSAIPTGFEIVPCLDESQQAIYSYLYEVDFYRSQVKWTLSGIGGAASTSAWTNIKEWNRSISRGSRAETARVFKDLLKDAEENLKYNVMMYLKFGAIPGLIQGTDTEVGYYGGYGYGYGNYGGYSPRNFPNP